MLLTFVHIWSTMYILYKLYKLITTVQRIPYREENTKYTIKNTQDNECNAKYMMYGIYYMTYKAKYIRQSKQC